MGIHMMATPTRTRTKTLPTTSSSASPALGRNLLNRKKYFGTPVYKRVAWVRWRVEIGEQGIIFGEDELNLDVRKNITAAGITAIEFLTWDRGPL
jgi:hypothetical protein